MKSAVDLARSSGVPEFWIEDCVAEMRAYPSRPLRGIAVDYARRFGPASRSGVGRLTCVQISEGYVENERTWMPSSPDFTGVSDAVLDFAVAFKQLPPKQQEALARRMLGWPSRRNADDANCYLARRNMRRLLED